MFDTKFSRHLKLPLFRTTLSLSSLMIHGRLVFSLVSLFQSGVVKKRQRGDVAVRVVF